MAIDDVAPGDRPEDEEPAPPIPDDPRVPRPEDADPRMSKELGGAAPAVGPGPARPASPEEPDEPAGG